MIERPESIEVLAYRSSHPITRGKYQRARSRHRAWASQKLTEAELAGGVPEDPERAQLVEKVLRSKGKLAEERERLRQRHQERADAFVDPFYWVCWNCHVGGDDPLDTVNDYARRNCYTCQVPRPHPDSYKAYRWVCNHCEYRGWQSDSCTTAGHHGQCPHCGEVCSWDPEQHRFWKTPRS